MEFGPDDYGNCSCDRIECEIARAVRRAAADACLTAIEAEFGPSFWRGAHLRHLSTFPVREWPCVAFPWRSDRACPGCGYVPRKAPAWATHKAVFCLNGKAFRIVSVGSTNRYSNNRLHSEDFITAEPISAAPWALPDLPAPIADVASALTVLFKELPRFRAVDLEKALYCLQPKEKS